MVSQPLDSSREPLLKTKLFIPQIRTRFVSRPRLFAELAEGTGKDLTLVCAPAGYGKTSLVVEWISNDPKENDSIRPAFCWFSLDEGDNDPARFLSYLIAAFEQGNVNFSYEISSLRSSFPPPPLRTVLAFLINELAAATGPIILILDDYQFISNPIIHDGIAFFLDHIPAAVHLVIATRSDPPLPLARLRTRGQMVELRAADLRFSEPEAAQFLNDVMGLRLDGRSITVLKERTEGWIAGLQMAALSLRDHQDVPGFIESFSGTHRYILDYLLEEILANQSPEIQHFLLYTSILERMNAPLCESILRDQEIGDRAFQTELSSPHPGRDLLRSPLSPHSPYQQILEYLERENIFLVPLDDERHWYRFHHLFADLLQKQLAQNYPQLIPELHRRASRWYEDSGFLDQALEHAFQAHDYPSAARLLEKMSASILSQTNRSWAWQLRRIQKLPEAYLHSNARLLVLQATLLASEGRVDEAEGCLLNAERCAPDDLDDRVPQNWIAGRAAAVRVMIASFRNDTTIALQYAQQALQFLSADEDLDWRAYLLITISRIHLMEGDLEASDQNLREALEIARLHGYAFMVLDAIAHLTPVLWMQGRLMEANRLCQDGQQYLETKGLTRSPVAGVFYLNWGLVLCEQHDLSKAEEVLHKGLELTENASLLSIIWAKQIWTRFLIAKGDLGAAQAVIREILSIQQQVDSATATGTGFSAVEALVWLRLGEIDQAEQYFIRHPVLAEGTIAHPHQWEYHALARLMTVNGELDAASQLLRRLLHWAENGSQHFWAICYWIDLAIVTQALGTPEEALRLLDRAMAMAEPEQIIQVFLDEGKELSSLLSEAARQGVHPEFARALLAALPGDETQSSSEKSSRQPVPGMVELLTERELEVLQLLALGKTNKEIAKQLIISPGTVKAHTASIYRKLDVARRTEAVARARQLSILP